MHISYLVDNPECRALLKELGAYDHSRRNMRGFKPSQLRHHQKVDSDESDGSVDEAATVNETVDQHPRLRDGAFDADQLPILDIKHNKHHRTLYKHPDYAFVTREETLEILLTELKTLALKGGVYYEVFDKLDCKEPTKIVVVFFEDRVFDVMAEIMGVKARLS